MLLLVVYAAAVDAVDASCVEATVDGAALDAPEDYDAIAATFDDDAFDANAVDATSVNATGDDTAALAAAPAAVVVRVVLLLLWLMLLILSLDCC